MKRLSALLPSPSSAMPLLCFSHLRWDFVRQRPQHLLSRAARSQPVWYWEEHIPTDHHLPYLEQHDFPEDGVVALRPRIPRDWDERQTLEGLRSLLRLLQRTAVRRPAVHWYYTPLMREVGSAVDAAAIVFDCMDELSAFAFADARLVQRERELMEAADVVFTGGKSLYDARRNRHHNVHLFPSSVDAKHFAGARSHRGEDPADQRDLPSPRLGYVGVIDERVDLDLVAGLAQARPDWSIIMVGPVVKIDPGSLPHAPNLHWLGGKKYAELPAYLAGWDVALMPFARNDATRYISPTKTPEYLAAGLPVVSTSIADVVATYGDLEAVAVADSVEEFVSACERQLALNGRGRWLELADDLLATMSWDATFDAMRAELDAVVAKATEQPAPGLDGVSLDSQAKRSQRARIA